MDGREYTYLWCLWMEENASIVSMNKREHFYDVYEWKRSKLWRLLWKRIKHGVYGTISLNFTMNQIYQEKF